YATGQLLSAKQISGADTLITTNARTGIVTVVPTIVGRKIENTPERTLSIATEYRFARLSVNGAAYYISERAVNAFNQAFTPGYTLFDLGAAYTSTLDGRATTLRVTGQNVANRKYFASTGQGFLGQGPPRMIKFSVTTRF